MQVTALYVGTIYEASPVGSWVVALRRQILFLPWPMNAEEGVGAQPYMSELT